MAHMLDYDIAAWLFWYNLWYDIYSFAHGTTLSM